MRNAWTIQLTLALLVLTSISCKMENEPRLSLLIKSELLNFPSASAIEFHNNRLYVIGDDARNLFILDKDYNLIDSVEVFPGEGLRIPKKTKTDLEASTIIMHRNREHLLVAGSGSKEERECLLLFPLHDLKNHERISLNEFNNVLRTHGLRQINIEGLAAVKDMLVFGNRGNLAMPENHLIAVPAEFINAPGNAKPQVRLLNITDGKDDGPPKGVSGLAYIASMDMLLFTASVELTDNAVDDGGIGNSYLGYIRNFSVKMNSGELRPDKLFNLSEMKAEFSGEKIESVAVESAGSELILHLVADNDDGTSTLFKCSLANL